MAIFNFKGEKPPAEIDQLQFAIVCPYCKTGSTFTRSTNPSAHIIRRFDIKEFTSNYACDLCHESVPVVWDVKGTQDNRVIVVNPRLGTPNREPFDFDYVPEIVRIEIEEALSCLSVDAFNAFGSMCRRVIQAICTDLGARSTSKVKQQIEEMFNLSDLEDEWKEIIRQIMLGGHNGSHPHLPEMNSERAAIILPLLRDLTYELYTRPGKVKASSALRKDAIDSKKNPAVGESGSL